MKMFERNHHGNFKFSISCFKFFLIVSMQIGAFFCPKGEKIHIALPLKLAVIPQRFSSLDRCDYSSDGISHVDEE